jgi:hypothetical protein
MARTKSQVLVSELTLDNINFALKQIEDQLDLLNGLHGPVNVYSDVTVHGNLTVTGTVTTANGTTAPETVV